ncbi:biopolymer transporter ExbD [Dasania sp. GY-MA-18]|uniref:Biopolymer transporter ExbD n=1 Tax=Dasania phycosphaerae TaxID=2950436 RepID=A0A9J6RHD6_9GAMM|nr:MULTISPECIES: biopolymer transporter ExbD [Dasania]MCR8921342.1 biopolymer transporter ExbD [Dasania sp. GY-MA-18]MCZ0863770.1 biopolymer transporter ExbD [Dasania phycosphaerae]MCZ0867498.1 biopolymer transporter ExbD [Dasania phycosphaerae]
MKKLRTKENTAASIDLTPMLDVVFIMLIFFIVTASFIKEASITLDRPDSSALVKPEKNQNITATIHPDNQISIDKRFIDKRALRAYFERHSAKNPEANVIIQAHNQSTTATLTAVADAARAAGILGVSLNNNDEIK